MNNASAKGLAILSGSPQAEKSILGCGLAVRLAERGVRVLYIDLYFSQEESCFSGVHRRDLHAVTTLDKEFVQLVSTGDSGFDIIRCCLTIDSGISEKTLKSITDCIGDSSTQYESIVISAPCGINPLAMLVAGMCEEIILTIDPEASSVASAYCLLKTLAAEGMSGRIITAFLNVDSSEQANSLKKKFDHLTNEFLDLNLGDGGHVRFQQENDDKEFIANDRIGWAREYVKNIRFEGLRMFQTETKKKSLAGIYPSQDEPGRYKTG